MPELPEVETIIRELKSVLIGKKFASLNVKVDSIFLPSAKDVTAKIKNLKILDIQRRGKFIVLVLDKKMRLVIHLRMTGRLLWNMSDGREKFICGVFSFTDGTSLIYSDVRKFGKIWLYNEKDYEQATGIKRLGIEPFDSRFSLEYFLDLFADKKGILKNTLLRQDIIAGIGNIYADEVCFKSRLNPKSRLEKLKKADYIKLYLAIISCLEEGINHNGTSVSDFVGTRGTLGKHQHYLQVYGRKGDPCYVCKNPIKKTVVAGRGTFYCENCQKL
ncbi:MAG: DNA-formamidopyrimidine glycosylase [Candidatus Gracilibacteria bacterium]|jgi:formamidopyrimidine-DNA glycosylase